MGYAEEKVDNARRILGRNRGGKRQALLDAFVEIVPVRDSDLPASLRADFVALRSSLTAAEPKANEGRARATIEAMSDLQVDTAIASVRSLAETLLHQR